MVPKFGTNSISGSKYPNVALYSSIRFSGGFPRKVDSPFSAASRIVLTTVKLRSEFIKVVQMFAVIEDGSRQHRVQEGDLLSVDYRDDVEVGGSLKFERVLLANGGGASIIGAPLIEGASVEGEIVLDEEKGPKLEVQKIRRRKNSRRHTGHRQKYTRIKITSISVPNLEVVESKDEATKAEPEAAKADDSGSDE